MLRQIRIDMNDEDEILQQGFSDISTNNFDSTICWKNFSFG